HFLTILVWVRSSTKHLSYLRPRCWQTLHGGPPAVSLKGFKGSGSKSATTNFVAYISSTAHFIGSRGKISPALSCRVANSTKQLTAAWIEVYNTRSLSRVKINIKTTERNFS